MSSDQPHLVILDTGVGVLQGPLAGAQRLDLGALQRYPAFEGLDDVVLMACAPVLRETPVVRPADLGIAGRVTPSPTVGGHGA